jgi:choline kinase
MTTHAIILAAGFGSRLRPHTDNRPKSMVPLAGRTLLERQREVLADCGISDVSIVVGHGAASVPSQAGRHILNPDYAKTNMVVSLMCADAQFDGSQDILVVYGDIVFERKVLSGVLAGAHAISVAVDLEWRKLWDLRMEDPLGDAETMKLGAGGRILELGKKPCSASEIEGQYMGLFRIAADQCPRVRDFYRSLDRTRLYDGRPVETMFMTSFVQELIDAGFDVGAALVRGGWLEIDSVEDLARYEELARTGELRRYYDETA